MRPATPYVAANDGSVGRTPWPHSQICVASQPTSRAASATIARDASINARTFARGGTGREDRGATGEIVRRRALGVGPVLRHDAQVPVLDTGMEAHAVAAVAERGVERGDDRMALRVRRMAGREVDHRRRRVGRQRDEVAAVRDLVGRELDTHRGGLDRRAAGVVARRVEPEDRHVADVAAGRQSGRDDGGAPDLAAPRQRGEARHRGDLERRLVTELGDGLVGTTVGNEHDVLHAAAS